MKILIGVPTAEMTRYGMFYDYLNMLEMPQGAYLSFVRGQSPAAARNVIIQMALDGDFTHILFIDDDVIVKPDLLKRLLAHDKDIVTGLYLMRNYPHAPIIFDVVLTDARCHHHFLNDHEHGLVDIVACGLGACLIKTEVFRAMEKPWVRLGELDKENWNDDIGFCHRVREAGFEMFCDLDCHVGHISTVVLWPNKVNGQWVTTYNSMGKESPSIPAATMEMVYSGTT